MNKKLITTACLALLFVFIGWMVYLSSNKREDSLEIQPDIQISKVIKYRIEVSNQSNQLIEKPQLSVAIPADLARHKVSDLSISSPFKKEVDDLGNVSVDVDLNSLVPYETKLVDISINLTVFPKLTKSDQSQIDEYTKPEKYIESDNEKIIQQANFFKADTKREQAKKTYDWVVGYLSDSGFVEEDRGALYALKHKKADCTGYMYLYGALLRANGIPARMMSGFVVETNKKLKIKDYHNWVEVYLDGIWRVVDPQKKKFLEDESNYIAMRIVNNSKSTVFDNSQQLFIANSGIKVSMK